MRSSTLPGLSGGPGRKHIKNRDFLAVFKYFIFLITKPVKEYRDILDSSKNNSELGRKLGCSDTYIKK